MSPARPHEWRVAGLLSVLGLAASAHSGALVAPFTWTICFPCRNKAHRGSLPPKVTQRWRGAERRDWEPVLPSDSLVLRLRPAGTEGGSKGGGWGSQGSGIPEEALESWVELEVSLRSDPPRPSPDGPQPPVSLPPPSSALWSLRQTVGVRNSLL